MAKSEYFDAFQTITYKGYEVKDIMRRVKILDNWEANPVMFLPYTVEADQTAEDVAYNYYGDPHLVWLVYLANDIINPYTDWVMPTRTFQSYLEMKYKEQSKKDDKYEIIAWTQATPKFYIDQDQRRITNLTYDMLSPTEKQKYTRVSYFDYEEWKNESKRNIRLVNAELAGSAIRELRDKIYVKPS